MQVRFYSGKLLERVLDIGEGFLHALETAKSRVKKYRIDFH